MKIRVTNELLAAYAEGNVTPEEQKIVRQYLVEHPEQMECLLCAIEDDAEVCDTCNNTVFFDNLASMLDEMEKDVPFPPLSFDLPMTAKVAQNMVDNRCALYCEGLALRHFGVEVDDETLLREALGRGWLRSEGTALCDVGRLAGIYGLSVSHRYYCKIEEVCQMMGQDCVVIAAVDGNELSGDYAAEQCKDREVGPTPNHVAILVRADENFVTLIDPATPQRQNRYPLSRFLDAWADSANSLVVISNSDDYVPHPIDLSDVKVEEELIELREAIAENAHEVWAEERRKEGWSYGPVRDDERKFHPDMLPYNRLPESEKEYDRLMALNTIKLVKKLGWELKKNK